MTSSDEESPKEDSSPPPTKDTSKKPAKSPNMMALAEVSSFEDLLKALGTEGKWSTMLFFLLAGCAFVSPMQTLSYQFMGATPDYWCHIDPLVQANWTDDEIISLAIPMKDDKERESCKMFDFNFTEIADLGYEAALSYVSEINATAVPCYARDFNLTQYKSTVTTEWDLVCDRRVLYSTTQAAAQAGKLLGYLVMGTLLDSLGRRPVVLVCSVLTIVSGFLASASPNIEFYIFLKIIITIMTSGVYLGCFVMAMETCSSQQRSKVGSFFVMPWAIGYMVLPGIAYLIRTWQWLQAALTVPALLLLFYFWLLPESPRWLILKGRYQEALKILKKAIVMNGKTCPSDKSILSAMERVGKVEAKRLGQSSEQLSFNARAKKTGIHLIALFTTKALLQRTLVVFFCWFAAAMVYYGVALNATNLSADPYIYVFLGGLLEVPSYALLWPAIVYLGRTKSLAALYAICGISILLVMVVLFIPAAPIGLTMFLSLTGKMAITAAFHLAWMFTAELFPTKFRSMAVGQASFIARIGSISSPYINDILGELVVWAPSLLFGVISLIAAGLSLLLPETRGKDLPESNEFSMEVRRGASNVAYVPETNDKTNDPKEATTSS